MVALLPPPTEGARLTFEQLSEEPPQAPPTETYEPEIFSGSRDPADVTVLPPVDTDMESAEEIPPVFLMRQENASQAYGLIAKPSISLDHHGAGWGCILFAIVYERINDTTFRAPQEANATYVAIKKLNKKVVAEYLRRGGEENPYKEIYRMQELGDNIHVLKCVEALQDEEFVYIITPRACATGTLRDLVPWLDTKTIDSSRARKIFIQILQILAYLELHNICHRDLSPDNFMFLTPTNLVVFDFALSLRMPSNADGQRALFAPQGNFGTRAYMEPTIFMDRVFDGVYSDLWSALVILYNLLTSQVLYEVPHPVDVRFRYFILAKALSSTPMNEMAVQAMIDIFGAEGSRQQQHHILSNAMANLNIGPAAMEIFEKCFRVSPAERWTLAQVIESKYIQQGDD
ncbi:predicted protein [Phaeodactylum tricornutum CCAP 1055/1]|jgi:serine/threonine protein kinase|uniref:Protein kinase domain-containing protein n=1 Tax=Phaeodactylum tricornutum (strain CCAP 1055/1) TaxID=556484 RepID=B7G8C8_PHATC|nr:predicted protein [Phaeodactylum tricornutum CCAP 1055/1]EEC45145.1 predicted protein [Phaeodactylum tricornutum CCAP 1055/1]|eukprot:XP_002183445.1 predicted protein [Phaeodactylum tricornutum CCAP 1055/1]